MIKLKHFQAPTGALIERDVYGVPSRAKVLPNGNLIDLGSGREFSPTSWAKFIFGKSKDQHIVVSQFWTRVRIVQQGEGICARCGQTEDEGLDGTCLARPGCGDVIHLDEDYIAHFVWKAIEERIKEHKAPVKVELNNKNSTITIKNEQDVPFFTITPKATLAARKPVGLDT